MLAEMYGMMPSANTVARPKLPPANRSYRLNSVPCPWFRRKSARAWTFTPGVAMCAPMRYTTRHRSVKRIFSFSSGTLNRLGSRGAVIDSARDRPARLLDLRAGGGRHLHALHAELPLHVAGAQQLDRMVRPADQARAEQRFGRHLEALGELAQVPDVDHLRRLLERVREPALGDAADERHLTALEPGAYLAALTRGLPLTATTCRLADARAGTAPLADAGAMGARRRSQGGQGDTRYVGLGRLRRPGPLGSPGPWLRLRFRLCSRLRHCLLPCLYLRRRHLDEMTHLIQHAPERRAVGLHYDVPVVLQAKRFERAPLGRG